MKPDAPEDKQPPENKEPPEDKDSKPDVPDDKQPSENKGPPEDKAPKKWAPVADVPAARGPRVFASNHAIVQAWKHEHLVPTGKRNNILHWPANAGLFVDVLEASYPGKGLFDLNDREVAAIIEAIGRKCSKFQRKNRNGTPACQRGLDLATCPLMTGAATSTCPEYARLTPNTLKGYYTQMGNLYRWAVREGYTAANPVEAAQSRWFMVNQPALDRIRRNPRKRNLSLHEVTTLVRNTPIHLAVLVALCACCFLRVHEAVKISLNPAVFNLKEGWILLPDDPEFGDKRKGNNRLIIMPSLRHVLVRYLRWREERVRRNPDGSPVTDKLVLTSKGEAWCPNGFQELINSHIHKQAVRLGLMTGEEDRRELEINSHCYRGFATAYAMSKHANELEIKVLKGDRPMGAIQEYDNLVKRLPELYDQFAPVLDVW